MFAITGVTGKVGGAVARSLLAQEHKVRAVVRDAEKGRSWSPQGCDIAIASVEDAAGLTKAFHGAEGVFLMTPPDFDPEPGFDIAAGFSAALERPVRVEAVPRDQWETSFRSQGAKNPMARIRMIDGFNESWIDFESGEANSRKERTTLEEVLRSLVTSNPNS